MAEQRWRRLNGYGLLSLVRQGVRFIDGVPVEREDTLDQMQDEALETRKVTA